MESFNFVQGSVPQEIETGPFEDHFIARLYNCQGHFFQERLIVSTLSNIISFIAEIHDLM